MTAALPRGAAALALLVIAGCATAPTPSPTPAVTPSRPAATPSPTSTASVSAGASPSLTGRPSPSAAPPLSLELPDEVDPRVVAVSVSPDVPAEGEGRLLVTVTSAADTRIDELVLRWPEELRTTLAMAPFTPTPERIADGGAPLVQPWTKWVVGPGEQGEPAGTVSLGWGPLLPGATLEIPIVATRAAPGSVAFDLQVLAGGAILTLADGSEAELRVTVD